MKINSEPKHSKCRWLYIILLLAYISILSLVITDFFNVVHNSLKFVWKPECSLDHIDICQSHGLGTEGTFLHVLADEIEFGSQMNQLLLAFAYSVTTRRQFLVDDQPWRYGSFHKYFDLGTRHCNLAYEHRMLDRSAATNQQVTHLKSIATSKKFSDLWFATRDVQNLATQRKVAHYLWKSMTSSLSTSIQNCKHRDDDEKNYIGIQIQSADKVEEERRKLFSKFTSAIESLLTTNVTVPIFVASDDQRTLHELRRLKFDWRLFGFEMEFVLEIGESDNFEEEYKRSVENKNRLDLQYLICQIQMLIHAEVVFCSRMSTICELVQVLREQHPETLIWVD